MKKNKKGRAKRKYLNWLIATKNKALPTFDIVVIGTMSAGKSTLINALIGEEVLPIANEAATAVITRIYDEDGMKHFQGRGYHINLDDLSTPPLPQTRRITRITPKQIEEWNQSKAINYIDLRGDIKTILNDKAALVIYDTPGPNNSQDSEHSALTMYTLENEHYGLILYLLNATQVGIYDDRGLLEKIKKHLEKDLSKSIVFVLNKCDMLDTEKGENIERVVSNVHLYLQDIGFTQPHIIPLTARPALLARKRLSRHPLTRAERSALRFFAEEACQSKSELLDIIQRSGFSELEKYLQTRVSSSNHLNSKG
ncbi:dynamin family protein [Suttonella ornithocola]|uniref:GTPase Era n=1 Tax=Suttonella ornithocola TaxID=279832 RepID=A0A380N058_9GAMM|nr:dynamin family protein [Suttonella ornithocola]SUO97908.1 GTPase Era [Suttonella ornithocola]